MNRKQYLEYVDHFNHKRFDKVAGYFTPDVTVEYPDNFSGGGVTPRTLHGPKEFIDNYVSLTSNVKEVLEVTEFLSQGNQLFVELYTEFHTFNDVPAGPGSPGRKKGDISIMNNWVLYDLDDQGRMKRIRIAHFRNVDHKLAKYK